MEKTVVNKPTYPGDLDQYKFPKLTNYGFSFFNIGAVLGVAIPVWTNKMRNDPAFRRM
jgi:hypothetical protein